VVRLHAPAGLRVTIILPDTQVLTKDSRAVLAPQVKLTDHIQQSANLGGLVAGLFHSDLELIARSMEDLIIEPQRAALIPNFYEVKDAARKAGALGCSISGAGPAIFALSPNTLIAEEVGIAMEKAFADRKISSRIFQSGINPEGAVKC
jgi:homoserine kinase